MHDAVATERAYPRRFWIFLANAREKEKKGDTARFIHNGRDCGLSFDCFPWYNCS